MNVWCLLANNIIKETTAYDFALSYYGTVERKNTIGVLKHQVIIKKTLSYKKHVDGSEL